MAASAKVQNNWRTILARVFSRDVVQAQKEITRFKIGEGGFNVGPPKTPKTPDETLVDLESEGEPLAGGGTVQFVNGSTAVTGLGTSFLADVSVGDWIKPGPTASSNPYSAGTPGSEEDGWGQVQLVNNNLSITLTANYVGATHLLAEGRPCHKASEPLFTFRKTLAAGDVLFNSVIPAITEITATVGAAEANADQLGGSPEFFELGLFDDDGVMVVYVTFDEEEKIVGVQLVHVIDLTF